MTLRAMTPVDLPQVISLIESHDEDDAEDASIDYDRNGLEHQYVYLLNDNIIGVTGFREIPYSNNIVIQ